MDLGPWVQEVLASGQAPVAAAFLIGLLASLGPCPLATNIAALGYISKDLASPYRVLLTGALYTLGRTLAYGLLGIAVLTAGVQISRISNSLQALAEVALGPLLVVVGLILLDLVHPTLSVSGQWQERLAKRLAGGHSLGAFLLGALFALAFCPYSAALYFGVLIPLVFKSAEGIAFPFLYGIGTSVPVIVIGVPLALGIMRFAAGLQLLQRVERAMRKVAALSFVGAGVWMFWNWFTATWL